MRTIQPIHVFYYLRDIMCTPFLSFRRSGSFGSGSGQGPHLKKNITLDFSFCFALETLCYVMRSMIFPIWLRT